MSVDEYKQKALQQANFLRTNPPPCSECRTPTIFSGEEGGWSDRLKLDFLCPACGETKRLTVEWGWSDRFKIY